MSEKAKIIIEKNVKCFKKGYTSSDNEIIIFEQAKRVGCGGCLTYNCIVVSSRSVLDEILEKICNLNWIDKKDYLFIINKSSSKVLERLRQIFPSEERIQEIRERIENDKIESLFSL